MSLTFHKADRARTETRKAWRRNGACPLCLRLAKLMNLSMDNLNPRLLQRRSICRRPRPPHASTTHSPLCILAIQQQAENWSAYTAFLCPCSCASERAAAGVFPPALLCGGLSATRRSKSNRNLSPTLSQTCLEAPFGYRLCR